MAERTLLPVSSAVSLSKLWTAQHAFDTRISNKFNDIIHRNIAESATISLKVLEYRNVLMRNHNGEGVGGGGDWVVISFKYSINASRAQN